MTLVELAGGSWARDAKLYLRGQLPSGRGLAVVGTREASDAANRFAFDLAARAAREGFVVWSGGARGVDGEAHRGALSAGGTTVVAVAGGHERPYPPEHRALFSQIAERGAALALVEDEVPAARFRFHHRNALMVALTEATVVVQAKAAPSGALHAAMAARRVGKPLLVVPYPPWASGCEGSRQLLAAGALPLHSADDVFAVLERAPQAAAARAPQPYPRIPEPPPPPRPLNLSADQRAVLLALDDTPRHIDELCAKTSLSYAKLTLCCFELCASGHLVEAPPLCYRLNPRPTAPGDADRPRS